MEDNKTLTELEIALIDLLNKGFELGYNNCLQSQGLVKMEDVVRLLETEIDILNEREHVYRYTIHTLNIVLNRLKNLK